MQNNTNRVRRHRTADWSVTLEKVTIDTLNILLQLYQFYEYDKTRFTGDDIDPETGRFPANPDITAGFHYYFIHVNGALAGYAKVERPDADHRSTAEPHTVLEGIFLLLKYRDEDIEQDVAKMLFDMYPGEWLLFQWPLDNTEEYDIYSTALTAYAGSNWQVTSDVDCNMHIFSFHTDDRICE